MERLLSHHQHSVFSILPHIFIHIEGRYWHVDPTRQKLHLNQEVECINISWFMELTYFRVYTQFYHTCFSYGIKNIQILLSILLNSAELQAVMQIIY